MKKALVIILILIPTIALAGISGFFTPAKEFLFGGDITPLDQWMGSTSPYTAISPRTNAKNIYAPFSNATTSSLSANVFCLTGDTCIATWPTGGAGGGTNSKWATTSDGFITPNASTGIIVTNATSTHATTTNLYASNSFKFGSDFLTDITGSGILNTSGALTLDRTGAWTGTFDGQEGSYYLDATNLSNFDSRVNAYIHGSTTIPKTYTANTFTMLQTIPYASTTAITVSGVASTSVLRIDTLADGCLNITSGLVGRTTCGTVTGVTATWPIFSSDGATPNLTWGGLSTSSPLAAGANVLYATGVNTVASVATSTATISTGLSYSGTWGNLVGGVSGNLTNTGVITVGNGTGVTCSGTNPASCSLAAIAANSILANNTSGSAIPVALATSSFFSLTQPTTITYASTTALSVSGALMVSNASSSINNLKMVNASTTNFDASNSTTTNATTTTSWSDIGRGFRFIANFFTATSTTASVFPYASTTALSVSGALMVNAASSSINVLQNVYASSTALTVSGVASTTVLRIDRLTDGCLTMTSGLVGSAACSGGGTVSTGIAGQLGWYSAGGTTISGTSTNPLSVGSLNATSSSLTSLFAGNVGFGSTTPWAQVAINPNAGQASNKFVVGSSTATAFVINNAGFIGDSTTTPWAQMSINPIAVPGSTPAFVIGSSTATQFIVDNSGRVGVGTTSPNANFAINPTAGQAAYQFLVGSSTATSLAILNTGKIYAGGFTKQITPDLYPAFSYSTTTAWTGTTTIPLGPAFVAETWSAVQCFTDTGTLGINFNDGTNKMEYLLSSTTVGTFGFATNNTFTAAEKRYVDIGTPGSSPTKIACTVKKSID